ncbi:MAG TPA: HEAT repeat domain-containing protein [Candidatus Udaeobacter sp.]|nr:HEAT repeat domain-containing protein [Candidatus Udaeobacter sp.]
MAIAVAEDQRRVKDGELVSFLSAPDPAVRARAALALGRIQDSTSIQPLIPVAADPAFEPRREAVFALGQIALAHPGSPTLAPARPALDAALNAPDTTTVDLAIEALGKLGDKASTRRVASYLNSPSALLRGDAALALWRLADSTAIDGLIDHVDDPDAEVRWRVIYALEKVTAPDRIVLRVAQRLDDPEWLTRAYSARTLGRQKSTRATAYVLQLLDDPEGAVVVNAIRALQQIADSSGSFTLRALTTALKHPHPYVRVTAATALADRFAWARSDDGAKSNAVDSLLSHLRDPDAATRGACVHALASQGKLGQGNARGMLHDPSIVTQVATLQALPLLGERDALPLILPRLARDVPLAVRVAAAEALGALKARSAVSELRAALADSATLYVAAAAGALADLDDKASVPALTEAYARRARDADADARISIHDALEKLRTRAYADSLERVYPATNTRPASESDFTALPTARGAILHTNLGDIEWAFDRNEAPQTVKNFVRLADRGYFNGTTFHRVVPNFVIQDGDPTGTGSGGPGYTIRCEYNRLRYDSGMVGMALSGKDTGGSQWFITQSPQMHLNGRYTIFAHVTRGMDLVRNIVQGDHVVRVEILR